MFGDLSYYTRAKHKVLNILNDGEIIAKGSKICGLYILEGYNVFAHSSSANEDFLISTSYGILGQDMVDAWRLFQSTLMSFVRDKG